MVARRMAGLPHPWRRDPFPREARIDDLVARLHSFAASSDRCAKKESDNLYRDTETYRRLSQELQETEPVRGRDYDGLEGSLIELTRGWAPRKGYGKSYGAGITREEVHAELSDLIDRIKEFERDADADLAALLQAELQGVIDAYEKRKSKLGLLDFVDLLVRARDLIRGDADVRAEFQARFTHVFVDEFQDTDPIQTEILMLLASDDPEVWTWQFVRPKPGKLFVVGDPKQSIYRFRRADVSIYSERQVDPRTIRCDLSSAHDELPNRREPPARRQRGVRSMDARRRLFSPGGLRSSHSVATGP